MCRFFLQLWLTLDDFDDDDDDDDNNNNNMGVVVIIVDVEQEEENSSLRTSRNLQMFAAVTRSVWLREEALSLRPSELWRWLHAQEMSGCPTKVKLSLCLTN
jgi:hypothetical protein